RLKSCVFIYILTLDIINQSSSYSQTLQPSSIMLLHTHRHFSHHQSCFFILTDTSAIINHASSYSHPHFSHHQSCFFILTTTTLTAMYAAQPALRVLALESTRRPLMPKSQ